MASNMFLFTCVSLALLVLAKKISFVDGRPLNIEKNNNQSLFQTINKETTTSKSIVLGAKANITGAKLVSANSASISTKSPTSTSTSGVADASQGPPPPFRGVNDFRPTAPGHSPGVGHFIHN